MRRLLATVLALGGCRGPLWLRIAWGKFVFRVAPKRACCCGQERVPTKSEWGSRVVKEWGGWMSHTPFDCRYLPQPHIVEAHP